MRSEKYIGRMFVKISRTYAPSIAYCINVVDSNLAWAETYIATLREKGSGDALVFDTAESLPVNPKGRDVSEWMGTRNGGEGG